MKKLFFLFVSFLATTCLWAYDFQSGGLYYNITSSSAPYTVEVTYQELWSHLNYSGLATATIPESVTYNGTTYSVTSIGDMAFAWCFSLTSITIPNSVTSIGEGAFYECPFLTSITIPNSVTRIGAATFYHCSSLTSMVVESGNTKYDSRENCNAIIETATNTLIAGCQTTIIPNSVTSIGSHAFSSCETLTSITIPNSVTSIGDGAFFGCTSLATITIPNSVTSIGEEAFYYCSSLRSITIPNSVTSIKEDAFSSCSSLCSIVVAGDNTVYDSRENCNAIIETATNTLIAGCQNTTIPNSVTSIGSHAFSYCETLTSITIPNSVTSIGDDAFSDCSSLSSVTIGNSVTSIGERAFEGCSSLTSVTIPNSVTNIGWYAFGGCSSLTSVTIPNSVTNIGWYAFEGCSSLTSVTIPNSVTNIGWYAFSGCIFAMDNFINNSSLDAEANNYWGAELVDTEIDGLLIRNDTVIDCRMFATSITIPNSVTSIRYRAFYYCSSLTSITIPNSVTSIGRSAFSDCSSLTKTNYTGDIAGWCNIQFGDNGANPMYYSHNFYINDQEIKDLVIPNSVTSIGKYAFSGCSSLTSITCEAETPPTVGSDAFYRVSKSIPVYVPCGCVGAYDAADGWKELTNIQEPQAEYSIQVYAFNRQMGSAKVNRNSACGTQISASPNYGYHFVQWSDGNTDNPRTLVLTQDITLTAEFAPNQYTITTLASHNERGTTQGDTTVNYLESVTITATSNYGYHFVKWSDGNTDNPRSLVLTQDTTLTAEFAINTYTLTTKSNGNGNVTGNGTYKHGENVIISATADIGYHFVRWNDGNTDNPRTLVLTQDTILTAEFAQTFSGQCGDNLYWDYDKTNQTISITGSGDMYDYTVETQPWLLFKEDIKEVTVANTATSIGTSAFEGCIRLSKISLGTGLKNIAANAFAGCTRLYDIYVYATYPPFAEESSFANYNVYVYIPCEYQRDYILDVVWGKFKFIECIDSEDATTDGNVAVDPGITDVTITWPTESNAETYTIVIKKDGEVFCTLTFNAEGQLLNIAFAPSRDGKNHPAQYAEQTVSGYRFTVTGLEEGTHYTYNIDVRDIANKTINSHAGEFTTQSITAVDNIQSLVTTCQKLLRDGQLIILRDGKTYNVMGAEIQ